MTETETRAREYLATQLAVLAKEMTRQIDIEIAMRIDLDWPPNPMVTEMEMAIKMAREIGGKLIKSTQVDV